MAESNEILSVEGQLVGMPLAGPESFSQQQLAYLKRALGLDETVLFSSSSGAVGTATFNMSESVFNFERLRIDLTSNANADNWVSTVEVPTKYITNNLIQFGYTERYNSSWRLITWNCCYTATNSGATLQLTSNAYGGAKSDGSWGAGYNVTADFHVYKVVGIHRIAGGN